MKNTKSIIALAVTALSLTSTAMAGDFDLNALSAQSLRAEAAGSIFSPMPVAVKADNTDTASERLGKAPSQRDLQSFLDAPVGNYGITNKDLLLSRYPVRNVIVAKTSAGLFVLKVQYVLAPGKTPEMVEPGLKANLLGTVTELGVYKDFIVFEAVAQGKGDRSAINGAADPLTTAAMAQTDITVGMVTPAEKSAAGPAASEVAGDKLVGFGSICAMGKNSTDAVNRAMLLLNEPFVRLRTNINVWTSATYTGTYVQAPYKVLGQASVTRISAVATYNWLACLPVQGRMP